MGISDRWRAWIPIPTKENGFALGTWILLDGNRTAVTGALLTVTFLTMLTVGSVWTTEMQRLLTETGGVQTLLNTLLGGIILLVSIVVSINSIVLSHQITSLSSQQVYVEDALEFRREIGQLTDTDRSPTDPSSFLSTMATVIHQRADEVSENTDTIDEGMVDEITAYIEEVVETSEYLEASLDQTGTAQFAALWVGLGTDYSTAMDRSRMLTTTYSGSLSESTGERLEDLIRALELFTTGREYFKTLYYSREVAGLSRRLLIISLPAILVTATTILAINAGLFPTVWIPSLPPLVTFVAVTFTIALSPFVILTSHMLRLTTVSIKAPPVGPFTL